MYTQNFQLVYFHKYDMEYFKKMIPWERYMFIDMMSAEISAEDERNRDMKAQRDARNRLNV